MEFRSLAPSKPRSRSMVSPEGSISRSRRISTPGSSPAVQPRRSPDPFLAAWAPTGAPPFRVADHHRPRRLRLFLECSLPIAPLQCRRAGVD